MTPEETAGTAPEAEAAALAAARGHLEVAGSLLAGLVRRFQALLDGIAPAAAPAVEDDVFTPLEDLEADLHFLLEDLARAAGTMEAALHRLSTAAAAGPRHLAARLSAQALVVGEVAADLAELATRTGGDAPLRRRLGLWEEVLRGLAAAMEEASAPPPAATGAGGRRAADAPGAAGEGGGAGGGDGGLHPVGAGGLPSRAPATNSGLLAVARVVDALGAACASLADEFPLLAGPAEPLPEGAAGPEPGAAPPAPADLRSLGRELRRLAAVVRGAVLRAVRPPAG